MKDKFDLVDMFFMFYAQKRQAEIAGVTPGTLNVAYNNDGAASDFHITKIRAELERELSGSQHSTEYPEHRTWIKATLRYMKTMENQNDLEH